MKFPRERTKSSLFFLGGHFSPLKRFTRWVSSWVRISFLQNSFQHKIHTDFLILYYSVCQVKFQCEFFLGIDRSRNLGRNKQPPVKKFMRARPRMLLFHLYYYNTKIAKRKIFLKIHSPTFTFSQLSLWRRQNETKIPSTAHNKPNR